MRSVRLEAGESRGSSPLVIFSRRNHAQQILVRSANNMTRGSSNFRGFGKRALGSANACWVLNPFGTIEFVRKIRHHPIRNIINGFDAVDRPGGCCVSYVLSCSRFLVQY